MITSISRQDICAVIVLYRPSPSALEHAKRLSTRLPVIAIDNTEAGHQLSHTSFDFCHRYLANNQNLGIATALNIGIKLAKRQDKHWCLLLDQDSIIDDDFLDAINTYPSDSTNIAALTPIYYAQNLDKYGDLIQVRSCSIHRIKLDDESTQKKAPFIPVSYAITSGSLVNLSIMDKVGLHDEDLFIDFVDIEWGLRANNKGYQVLANTNAILIQQLGDKPIMLMNRRIVNHSATRHYYYFRNVMLMLRKPHVPRVWKIYEFAKLPARFLLYSLFAHPRTKQCRSMLKGIWHGINNKKGIKPQ
ncbi:glycosyltransferase family 2 protein [Vibrio natriegens]|uniref:Glycosyltransferase 2-like domain-containing protein n=2 Tax=Vibrio natriegens TaxID=691 RepID=A0AAN1CUI8_VIBNA|nr:glycosyltransferase family 2 protein [Vibrio natriegens]ALR16697.1 hypothetical protein PN96_12225 [Vibrio natriegens NBRC 15636 = ATCC 14048 = DSM 759]ANQ11437.1 hypothetical protein BA890_01105 [Vibrio natriegens NBRC 15636 = ATCC 14048 = DSM 759]EPM39002.1 hypothetical protein M272_18665 [Vibrio natriegens NBRC 15636 = ATCC 14048 = DSM 759]